MEKFCSQIKWQTGILVVLRIAIGWHILYEGIHKLIHPEWSALAFLDNAQWIFAGLADWIITNPVLLNIVDAMNTWGLILIGLGLVLGLFTRIASLAGFALLMLYYLFNPPFIGMEVAGTVEGNYLLINKTLIEAICLLYIAVAPLSRQFGLDMFWKKNHKTAPSHD